MATKLNKEEEPIEIKEETDEPDLKKSKSKSVSSKKGTEIKEEEEDEEAEEEEEGDNEKAANRLVSSTLAVLSLLFVSSM